MIKQRYKFSDIKLHFYNFPRLTTKQLYPTSIGMLPKCKCVSVGFKCVANSQIYPSKIISFSLKAHQNNKFILLFKKGIPFPRSINLYDRKRTSQFKDSYSKVWLRC